MSIITPYPGEMNSFVAGQRGALAKVNIAEALRYRNYLLLLILLYISIFSILLITGNFIPYVMDANESYSSLIHAQNLYHFGVGDTMGLTDETYGLNPEAHPYVYTHQGNFPRFFAWLLIILGAQSIELQTGITIFTVGLAAVFFAYHFFSRISSPLFAFVTCTILLTNYLLFTQWHVVTFRVWHAFFFFSTLLCVHALRFPRKVLWGFLTIINYICLFYYEFIFASFVAITAALYTACVYYKDLKIIRRGWSIQLFGALTAAAILIGQIIAYLGFKDFLKDAYLTFLARNFASNSSKFFNELKNFYDNHHIVFWYNLVDGSYALNFKQFIRSLLHWNFAPFTPFFCLLTFMLVGGWGVVLFKSNFLKSEIIRDPKQPLDWLASLILICIISLLVFITFHFQLFSLAILPLNVLELILLFYVVFSPWNFKSKPLFFIKYLPGWLVLMMYAVLSFFTLKEVLVLTGGVLSIFSRHHSLTYFLYIFLCMAIPCYGVQVLLKRVKPLKNSELIEKNSSVSLVLNWGFIAWIVLFPSLVVIAAKSFSLNRSFLLMFYLGLLPIIIQARLNSEQWVSFFVENKKTWLKLIIFLACMFLTTVLLGFLVKVLGGSRGAVSGLVLFWGGLIFATLKFSDNKEHRIERLMQLSFSFLIRVYYKIQKMAQLILCMTLLILPFLLFHFPEKLSITSQHSSSLVFVILSIIATIIFCCFSLWPHLKKSLICISILFIGFYFFLREATLASELLNLGMRHQLAITAMLTAMTLADFLKNSNEQLSLQRVLLASVSLGGLTYFISQQFSLYVNSIGLSHLWISHMAPSWLNSGLKLICMLGTAFIVVRIIVKSKYLENSSLILKPNIFFFLSCGLFSYGIVYLLFPGYIRTGYLERYVPFGVFVFQVFFAVGVFILINVLSTFKFKALNGNKNSKEWLNIISDIPNSMTLISAGLVLIVLTGYWFGMQYKYVKLMPPDRFSFLSELREKPFLGASFVSNTYAAPITYFTNQWSYYDPEISNSKINFSNNKFEISRDMHTYLWLADRNKNLEYYEPDYFVCMIPLSMGSVVAELAGKPFSTCEDVELVKRARLNDNLKKWPTKHIVIEDKSKRNAWAVVKLDWNEPPYLMKSIDSDDVISIKLEEKVRKDDPFKFWVKYIYHQNQNVPEGATQVRIYEGTEGELLFEQPAREPIIISKDFKGVLWVSIIPASARKTGKEYHSKQGVLFDGTNMKLITSEAISPIPSVSRIESDKFVISWDLLPLATYYLLEMRSTHSEHFTLAGRFESNRNYHEIHNIDPKTSYTFRLRACSDNECFPVVRNVTSSHSR